MRAQTLLLLALVPLASVPAAQLRHPGRPASERTDLPGDVPQAFLPPPPPPGERGDGEVGWPFTYGVVMPTRLDSMERGRWDAVPDTGELVWRLALVSPGAYSLGITFSEFDLPPGGELYLYDLARTEVLGAYTEANEKPNGRFAIQPVPGDRLVIEYVHPPRALALPHLVVGEVVYDQLDVLGRLSEATLAAGCLVDVNCPQGAPYQDVKRAVVWLLGGAGGCSGSLLNNTADDGTPYLMTAEHCGDMTNAVIVFDYERTGCGTGSSSQSKTLSGATFLKATGPYDAQLYLLTQVPPSSYRPFYAGWTLDEVVAPPGVGISHPAGNPKKIQIDNQAPTSGQTRWTTSFEVGIIQGGSSGSPLFDSRKRVIGTASAGISSCASNLAFYGRFDRFYETKDLEVFLDPLGLGLSGIDGYDPWNPYWVAYDGLGSNPSVLTALGEPRLGATFSLQVDLSGIPGATGTLLLGYGAPSEGVFGSFGELLIDPTSPILLSSFAPASGGVSRHDLPLPASPALAGRTGFLQAFSLGASVVATNGVKAIPNF